MVPLSGCPRGRYGARATVSTTSGPQGLPPAGTPMRICTLRYSIFEEANARMLKLTPALQINLVISGTLFAGFRLYLQKRIVRKTFNFQVILINRKLYVDVGSFGFCGRLAYINGDKFFGRFIKVIRLFAFYHP
jgi:hypothetical protein